MSRFRMRVSLADPAPKRGDLMQTAVGTSRERTWMILDSQPIKRVDWTDGVAKAAFHIWRERWWEIEVELRTRLHRSAERRGGQLVWYCERNPKPTLPRRSMNEVLCPIAPRKRRVQALREHD